VSGAWRSAFVIIDGVLERIARGDVRLSDYAQLRDPELMRRRGLFVAEGRLVVERVIMRRELVIRSILLNEAARRQLAPVLSQVDERVPVCVCDAGDLLALTGFNIHRGCLALVERPAPLEPAAAISGARTIVVLEGVSNPDNIGGVFRNVAAFGADAVVLSPTCCDPLYRKAIRTSMAATLSVPFARAVRWPAALDDIRSAGFRVVALTPATPADELERFAENLRPAPLALVIGTEGAGLSGAALALVDHRVRIPVRPEVDSLNLATAAAIALYRLITPVVGR
jgi:tRNA G18 (ribose-2'-O)-methylase SpoU